MIKKIDFIVKTLCLIEIELNKTLSDEGVLDEMIEELKKVLKNLFK